MDNRLAKYILKNQQKRDEQLKYDFMPSLLEIIERPSHIAGTVIVAAIFLLLITAIIWSALAKIDIVITGTGNLMPEGKVVELKPMVMGKVDKINVAVGDFVEPDQALLSLENETAAMDRVKTEESLEWNKIQIEIIQNRIENPDYTIPMENYDSKYFEGLQQMNLEIQIYQSQRAQRQKELDKANQELEAARGKNDQALITSLEERVALYLSSIESDKTSNQSQLYGQLFSMKNEQKSYEEQLKKADLNDENYTLKAPVAGYINSISVVSPKQVISPGESIISIVPSDSPLQFECFVSNKDRGELEVGQEVIVKLSAFSFSDFGAVSGKISYISPSSFTNEKKESVYVLYVDIDEKNINPNIELISGLSGNVEIITGQRTILQYFLDPIVGSLNESLKEP